MSSGTVKDASVVEMALELFVEAIGLHADLEILDTEFKEEDGREVFVISNSKIAKGLEGCKVEVDIDEVIKVVSGVEQANRFAKVIANESPGVVLHGVTRIVGYYSRTTNWNKSKIGELRDRHQQNYALSGRAPKHDDERIGSINNLS